jgi:single-strand DNA-binding protein
MAAADAQNPSSLTIFPWRRSASSSRTKLSKSAGLPLRFSLTPLARRFRRRLCGHFRNAIATGADAPTMESKMRTFAEFQILGRVGKVREVGQTTRVSICVNYVFKDRGGEAKDKPHWNEITIWTESTRKYVRDYAKSGDLVIARGSVKQSSFEKSGERIFTVDLNCDDFSIVASKHEKSDVAKEAPATETKGSKRK